MSMTIYASHIVEDPKWGKCFEPVFDFRHHDATLLASDADEREERGESAFIPNPDFIADSGMTLTSANARFLFEELGFDLSCDGSSTFPIAEVAEAALRGRNSTAATLSRAPRIETGQLGATLIDLGTPPDYMAKSIARLQRLVALGQKHGATHIAVA